MTPRPCTDCPNRAPRGRRDGSPGAALLLLVAFLAIAWSFASLSPGGGEPLARKPAVSGERAL